jgi:hypothetical protein
MESSNLFDLEGLSISSNLKDKFLQMKEAGQTLENAVFAVNKIILADFMRSNNLDLVVVEYSGSGDSGGVDSVTFCIGDRQVADTPQGRLSLLFVERHYRKNGDVIKFTTFETGAESAFERMAYEALDICGQGGWENDGGGQGEVRFTLANPQDEAVAIKVNHTTYITEAVEDEYDL